MEKVNTPRDNKEKIEEPTKAPAVQKDVETIDLEAWANSNNANIEEKKQEDEENIEDKEENKQYDQSKNEGDEINESRENGNSNRKKEIQKTLKDMYDQESKYKYIL